MQTDISCPIWGEPASLVAGSLEPGSEGAKINSVRAGGLYRITREVIEDYPKIDSALAAKLTKWMYEQRKSGNAAPLINSDVISGIGKRKPPRFSELRESFFDIISAIDYTPGVRIPASAYARDDDPLSLRALASGMGLSSSSQVMGLLRILGGEGYLEEKDNSFTLTAKGFERLDARESGQASLSVFVAMWFGEEMNDAYRLAIAPAIRDAGYEPVRVDHLEHNGKIDDEIIVQIKMSKFLVSDFTCGGVDGDDGFHPIPRGGVYYEAGFAHGLGKEVIFSCRQDQIDHLHFDTRQFAHIVWNSPQDLRQKLFNRIAATVGLTTDAPGLGEGAIDPSPETQEGFLS